MKKHLLLATALAAMASCTDSEFVGGEDLREANEQAAIGFGFDVPMATRAEGSDAASALGNRFIVYGEKGNITNAAPTAGNLVFPNYQVNYEANTAYTTTSNTKNWEYVGYTHTSNYQTNITRKATSDASTVNASDAVQTIKYWDYGAEHYVFTAVSADDADIENGRVKIQKNEYGTDAYEKGYTITLAKSGTEEPYTYPTLNKLFFSDRQVINQGSGTDRTAKNAYGGNVTLTFRNLVSQIRAGVYETIPGYSVTAIKFYVNTTGETPTQTEEAKVSSTNAFGAVCPNIKAANYEGTITVNYYTNSDGTIENQPKVTQDQPAAQNLILGTNMSTTLTGGTSLSTSASSPTWDTSAGAFTEVLPQTENATNLKLKVDYTLWNSVSGETIEVKGATAEIPAQYLQWKPNYKYTYLFKISDGGNGSTGQDVTGLYPITFDAVEVVAEDGQAEYITTVSEPSITTFGAIYNTTNSKYTAYQTEKDEYQAQSAPNQLDIYATFVKGSAVQTPSLSESTKANYVQIYNVTTSDATSFPITEASVAERLAETIAGTAKLTCTNITSDATTYFGATPSVVSSVPAEDGKTKTINAVKLTGVVGDKTYAIEYITYDEVTGLTVGTSVVTGYYTESGGTYTKITDEDTKAASDTKYYKQVKHYKVIKVAAAS